MIIDKTGSLSGIKRHDYLPFGEELGANVGIRSAGNGYTADQIKQKFTGYERDTETGLDFAQARYMSSIQGRFTSVDPDNAGAVFHDPQSWNAYAYVGNHPTTTTDPSGLVWGYNDLKNELRWFKTPSDFQAAYAEDVRWRIVDGYDFTITRSGSPNNPTHDYLRTGQRYTLNADGTVTQWNTPYFNAAGAFARQMQLRATATKQAIGLFGAPSILAMGAGVAVVTVEAVAASSAITTLGLGEGSALEAQIARMTYASRLKIIQTVNAQIGDFFGSNLGVGGGVRGAKAALELLKQTGKVPSEMTREVLLAYRETIVRYLLQTARSNTRGIETQAARLELIEYALKLVK